MVEVPVNTTGTFRLSPRFRFGFLIRNDRLLVFAAGITASIYGVGSNAGGRDIVGGRGARAFAQSLQTVVSGNISSLIGSIGVLHNTHCIIIVVVYGRAKIVVGVTTFLRRREKISYV